MCDVSAESMFYEANGSCDKNIYIYFCQFSKVSSNLPLVVFTHAQCLQHSSSGIGTMLGIWLAPHFKRFGGFSGTGQDGRHSIFPRSQKQCCSQPVKFTGISLQLSKCCPLYSHVPWSMQRIFSNYTTNICDNFIKIEKRKMIKKSKKEK